MMEFLKLAGIIFIFFGIAFALINLRHIFTGKEFRGTCASNNPMIKNEFGSCSVCGKSGDEACQEGKLATES